jgi:hypothetical protein
MNLRTQITNKLLELLFDGRHEYIPDCEDAALEIMKLIAADKEPAEPEATIPGLKQLAVKYRELMDERRLRIDANESVESLDDDIDELLNETMLLTQSLLSPESEPEQEPVSLLDLEISKWLNSGATNAQISRHICRYVSEQFSPSVSTDTKERSELAKRIIESADCFQSCDGHIEQSDVFEFFALSARLASLCSVHVVPSSDKE